MKRGHDADGDVHDGDDGHERGEHEFQNRYADDSSDDEDPIVVAD